MKRLLSKIAILAAVAAITPVLNSCDEESEEWFQISVADYTIDYNIEGYWASCYDTNPVATLKLCPVVFSHTAEASEWGGSWYGFCPSCSTDNDEYPADVRWQHQWAAITGTNPAGNENGYMLACWDVRETTTEIPANPSLKIALGNGHSFKPETIRLTNSAYAYYTMLRGSDFSAPFGKDSYLKINFIGVKDGQKTGTVVANLALGNVILDQWNTTELKSLGEVDYIYCQMESSDTGAWGMNTPAYFCFDDLTFLYQDN